MNDMEWTELDDMSTFCSQIKTLLELSDDKAQALETLIVENFAHGTEPGWCCACEADIAFAESRLERDGWMKPANLTEEQAMDELEKRL